MQYYEIIRALREDNYLTQTQVANMLGTDRETYSRYELNKQDLPPDILKKLCTFYKVSADYILGFPEKGRYPKR